MSPELLVRSSNYSYSPAKNDVWSLGVLLLNILSARNPWHIADLSDQNYAEFVNGDKRTLQAAFDLTEPVYALLLDVFVDEQSRIGVQEFRQRFEAIEWLCEGHRLVLDCVECNSGQATYHQGEQVTEDDVALYLDKCIIQVDSLDTNSPHSPITPVLMFEMSLFTPSVTHVKTLQSTNLLIKSERMR